MATPLASPASPDSAADARADAGADAMRDRWWTVVAVTLGAFVMVTSEFLPIGLLSAVAGGLRVPLAEASWLVTVPGIVAAIAAPTLTVLAASVDRRRLLIALSALVALSDLIVAMGGGFATALAGRVLLGVAVGGFWTFAAAVGRRLVSSRQGNRATALIMGGISAGTVLGVPAGAAMGELLGWRSAFFILAGLAALAALAQALMLPALPADPPGRRASLLGAMKRQTLRIGLIAAALMVAGHFAGFTYLQPLLSGPAALSPAALQLTLLLYGVAGLAGTWLAERAASRHPRLTFATTAASAGLALALLAGLAALVDHAALPDRSALADHVSAARFAWPVLVALWGLAFGALPVCVQIWLFQAAPEQLEAASALSVLVFQIALASGAFVGGLAVASAGLPLSFLIGGVLAALASLVLMRPAARRIDAPTP